MILDQTLTGDLLSLQQGFNALGDWRCRTLKSGKVAPIVVCGLFDCRITDDGAGWFLEKSGGSQRAAGSFSDNGDREIYYLGVWSVAGDAKVKYGAAPVRNQREKPARETRSRGPCCRGRTG